MPEYINRRIEHSSSGQYGNPHERVFKINSSGSKVNQVSGQGLGKPTGANKSAARGIDCKAGDSAHKQRMPGMTLQSDINDHNEGKVDIGEGRPNSP